MVGTSLYASLLVKMKDAGNNAFAAVVGVAGPVAEKVSCHGRFAPALPELPKTIANAAASIPEIREYNPAGWSSAAPQQDSGLNVPVGLALLAASYLALDGLAAYEIAKAGEKDSDHIPTIGPISAITRKLKYGRYFGEKMEYRPAAEE